MKTWRDVCVNLLALMGCFATINRLGKFEVRQFFAGAEVGHFSEYIIKSVKLAHNIHTFSSVEVKSGGRTITVRTNTSVDGGKTLSLGENQFARFDANEDTEGICSELLNFIKNYAYVPFSVSTAGDPSLELGDYIGGNSGGLILTAHTWRYRGSHDLIGVGENIATTGAGWSQKEVEKKLAEVGSAIIREKDRIQLYVDALDGDLRSLLEQTATDLTMRFDYTADINNLTAEIELDRSNMQTYIRFYQDGVEIGKNTSPVKTQIRNDRFAITHDGQDVAYLDANTLFVTHLWAVTDLRIGHYAFVPRENGNMSLVWMGW